MEEVTGAPALSGECETLSLHEAQAKPPPPLLPQTFGTFCAFLRMMTKMKLFMCQGWILFLGFRCDFGDPWGGQVTVATLSLPC